MTFFWVCFVVFTFGVDRYDIRPLGPVVSKPYAYSGEDLLISIKNDYFYYDLDRSQTDLVDVYLVGLQYMNLHSL